MNTDLTPAVNTDIECKLALRASKKQKPLLREPTRQLSTSIRQLLPVRACSCWATGLPMGKGVTLVSHIFWPFKAWPQRLSILQGV